MYAPLPPLPRLQPTMAAAAASSADDKAAMVAGVEEWLIGIPVAFRRALEEAAAMNVRDDQDGVGRRWDQHPMGDVALETPVVRLDDSVGNTAAFILASINAGLAPVAGKVEVCGGLPVETLRVTVTKLHELESKYKGESFWPRRAFDETLAVLGEIEAHGGQLSPQQKLRLALREKYPSVDRPHARQFRDRLEEDVDAFMRLDRLSCEHKEWSIDKFIFCRRRVQGLCRKLAHDARCAEDSAMFARIILAQVRNLEVVYGDTLPVVVTRQLKVALEVVLKNARN